MLIVVRVEITLGGDRDQAVSVVAKGDIKLPSQAMTCKGVIANEKNVEKEPY